MYNNNNNMYQQNIPPTNSHYYQQQQNNNNQQYIIRNVNNFDDAKNSNIDFYNTYLFTDFNNSNIYLRRINNNGLEEFYTFRLTENPPDRLQVMEQRMLNIEKMLERIGNNESNDVSADAESNQNQQSISISKGATNVARKK